MNPKLKRVIAIIALVFVGLFTVSFVAFLVNKQLFNGALGYFAGGCGAVGLALFFVIKLSREYPEEESELKKILDKDEGDESGVKPESSEEEPGGESAEKNDKPKDNCDGNA